VGRAVNVGLTLRNWVIGCYIREYEQNGADRAQYGGQVLGRLSLELQASLDKCYSDRYLRFCRQFYETYPQIRKSVISKFRFTETEKGKSAISELPSLPESDEAQTKAAVSPQLITSGDRIVERLSFTHIVELIKLDDPLKRTFYEIECLRGNWSVRELKRQIGSLYYERSGRSAFYSVRRKTTPWWNMPWPGWTTIFLFPSTNSNYPRKKKSNVSWKSRSGNRNNEGQE
jgi:hypothetical protein